MIIKITSEYDSLTVKEILYNKLSLSRAQIIALKKDEEGILLCGHRVTVRAVVHTGDVLALKLEDSCEDINRDIEPVALPLDIIYEDDDIVLCNKPSGMPTHPSHNHHYDTLANALCYYYKEQGIPFVFRAVNRLDADTSGVVLVAKNRRAAYVLGEDLRSRKFEKNYYAILKGVPAQKSGSIENYICRREDSIIFRCVREEGTESEYAHTTYEVLSSDGKTALVKAFPHTGRTHQLRVHFAYIGCPILGDGLYGECGARLMLHAADLSFEHPSTGEKMTFNAPMPTEFSEYTGE